MMGHHSIVFPIASLFIRLVLLPAPALFDTTMSSFSRVFQRTARSAFQYNRSVNPVQNALGAQGTGRFMNGVRNYAAFTRDKPHVNIGAPIHPVYTYTKQDSN